MHKHLVIVCDITVTKSLSVHLTVTRNAIAEDVWIWTYILNTGEALESGVARTKLAAQVAAQRTHERWLHKNRQQVSLPAPVSYHWREVE
jgi:hypothetical protein